MFINSSCASRFTLKKSLKTHALLTTVSTRIRLNSEIFFGLIIPDHVDQILPYGDRKIRARIFEYWKIFTYASMTFHLPSIIFAILFHFWKQCKFKLVNLLFADESVTNKNYIISMEQNCYPLDCLYVICKNTHSRNKVAT